MMDHSLLPITPLMAELGVIDTAMLITRFDEDDNLLTLEAVVLTDHHLTFRQCTRLQEATRDVARAAAQTLGEMLAAYFRSEDIHVIVGFGVYTSEEDN